MQSPVLAELDHDMPPEAGSLVTLGLVTEDHHDMVSALPALVWLEPTAPTDVAIGNTNL
jgi:hypothetical protein